MAAKKKAAMKSVTVEISAATHKKLTRMATIKKSWDVSKVASKAITKGLKGSKVAKVPVDPTYEIKGW